MNILTGAKMSIPKIWTVLDFIVFEEGKMLHACNINATAAGGG
jgi:hypothetical protein